MYVLGTKKYIIILQSVEDLISIPSQYRVAQNKSMMEQDSFFIHLLKNLSLARPSDFKITFSEEMYILSYIF